MKNCVEVKSIKKQLLSKKGELLIELIMSIALFALLLSAVVSMLNMSVRTFGAARDLRDSTVSTISDLESKKTGTPAKATFFLTEGGTLADGGTKVAGSEKEFEFVKIVSDDGTITRYTTSEPSGTS